MTYSRSKDKLIAINNQRDLLIDSLRERLLPVLMKQGFEIAPLVRRGPVDRELVESLPFGRLRRHREGRVDLLEIQFADYRRAAFQISAGVAPQSGLMTLTGHWSPEDLLVGWLNEFFVMYSSRRLGTWFSVWNWPFRHPVQADYDKLALKVANLVPEIELALREGQLGPHMRRIVIPRPPVVRPTRADVTEEPLK